MSEERTLLEQAKETLQFIPGGAMKTVWRKGPPPEIGWWPASVQGDKQSIRWWNGVVWSATAWTHMDSERAARRATIRDSRKNIKWTDRWWV